MTVTGSRTPSVGYVSEGLGIFQFRIALAMAANPITIKTAQHFRLTIKPPSQPRLDKR